MKIKSTNMVDPDDFGLLAPEGNVTKTVTTNLHFHGMYVSPLVPGDQIVHVHIPSGQSFQYQIYVPQDHPTGKRSP
jgi:hypothetical protein